jgi:HrpA-like RNA helicase
MKDVITQQEEQPWLISSEARVPSLNFEKTESSSSEQDTKSREISEKLRMDLELKRRLAEEWDAKNSDGRNDRRSNAGDLFSPGAFHRMMTARKSLPAYRMMNDIVRTIRTNQITVIAGATGCGKTTQVPQLVLDDLIMNNRGSAANIIVTQPRRISAIGVSERIAQERCEKVGETCG